MTSIEAYKKFELKVNKLSSADNIDISPGEFVLIFNEQQTKWYLDRYRTKKNEIQLLVEHDVSLPLIAGTSRYTESKIPENYLDYIKSYSVCSKEQCTGRIIQHFKVQIEDIELTLRDEYNSPSFEFRETPITIAKDRLQTYKTDFSIDSVFFTYYRYPSGIDIIGYRRVDGTLSTNINPELGDEQVNEIIDLCALEVSRSFENPNGFNLSTDRVNRNN